MNCDAEIHGRYCHVCGQENTEPKESAWSLVTHFFYDITHFDGKFFSTVKYLLLKPGFLSKEYIKGRRASYLHPIRMYVFTSAFFFIYFFSVVKIKDRDFGLSANTSSDSRPVAMREVEADVLREVNSREDSLRISESFKRFNTGQNITDSTAGQTRKTNINAAVEYKSVAAYDSAQAKLPASERDGWYKRQKRRKEIELRQQMNYNPKAFLADWMDHLVHRFPQLLFVSLPIFALLLKLLYFRRKQFYYADHAIFTIHLYIFGFVALFLFLLLNKLYDAVAWQAIRYLELGIGLYILIYTYKALRNFYQQGRMKTFFKFLLLNTLSFFMILFLFLVFIVLSIYEI